MMGVLVRWFICMCDRLVHAEVTLGDGFPSLSIGRADLVGWILLMEYGIYLVCMIV